MNIAAHLAELKATFRRQQIFERFEKALDRREPSRLFRPPLRLILEDVAQRHRIGTLDIRSANRRRHIVVARHEFMWLAVTQGGASNAAVGRFLGMDHTAVMHGVTRHAERIAQAEGRAA